jgi:hypothetical protein
VKRRIIIYRQKAWIGVTEYIGYQENGKLLFICRKTWISSKFNVEKMANYHFLTENVDRRKGAG